MRARERWSSSVRFSKRLAVAAMVALVGGIAAPGIAAAGTEPSWVIQSTLSPGGRQGSVLTGVSCPSATACTAVGGYALRSGAITMLAEHWTGATWVVESTPNPPGSKWSELVAVSCSSARACAAVGQDSKGTLAERWNGTKWAIQPTPNPAGTKGSELVAVSCSSAKACTAVGDYGKGAAGSTLAERWNGTKWVIQATPNPVTGTDGSILAGVSCSSARACTAVGEGNVTDSKSDTLAEHWNGTKWVIQPTPKHPSGNESELTGVSCRSATTCIATGNSGNVDTEVTLAERWNGRKWAVQPTSNPSGSKGSELAGVSCPSATACTAAGDYYNRSGTDVTLAERWNGRKWALQSTPNPSDAGASPLTGVSCSSATACTAVGPYIKRSGAEPTLAERYS
jgi:hypothetical protein